MPCCAARDVAADLARPHVATVERALILVIESVPIRMRKRKVPVDVTT